MARQLLCGLALAGSADALQAGVQAHEPGLPGLVLSRPRMAGELGSKMDIFLAEECEGSHCRLGWGDTLNLAVAAHVPSGAQPGDRIALNMVVGAKPYTDNAALNKLLAVNKVVISMDCELCDGSCKVGNEQDGTKAAITFPTMMINEEYCEGKQVKSVDRVTIAEAPVTLPGFETALADIGGHMELSVSLLSKTGAKRAHATSSVTLFARNGESLLQVGSQSGARTGRMGLLQRALQAAAQGPWDVAHGGARVLSLLGVQPQAYAPKADAMAISLTMHDMERGSPANMTFGGASSCDKPPGIGSFSCKFKYGSTFDVPASSMHLSANLEPGSKARVSIKPRIGGMAGMMMNKLLPSIKEAEVPLCGESGELFINNQLLQTMPIPCGFYGIDLESQPKTVTLPSLNDMISGSNSSQAETTVVNGIEIPKIKYEGMGTSLPPVSIFAHAELLHADGTTIANYDMEVGLTKALR